MQSLFYLVTNFKNSLVLKDLKAQGFTCGWDVGVYKRFTPHFDFL